MTRWDDPCPRATSHPMPAMHPVRRPAAVADADCTVAVPAEMDGPVERVSERPAKGVAGLIPVHRV
ncbi:hypothetical protein GCM10009608_76570 [Pseudonocardia alaniniphila]